MAETAPSGPSRGTAAEAGTLRFDLDKVLSSVVLLRAEVPEDAFTADRSARIALAAASSFAATGSC